jgi:hypothetical protein
MAAQFRIDQVTPGQGVLDRSRHDLIAGEIITLVVPSPAPGATYTWEIIDKIGSTATLSSTSGTSVTIGNAAAVVAFCGFLVELTETIGTAVSRKRRIASVRSTNTGIRPIFFAETATKTDKLDSNSPANSTDNALYSDRAGLGDAEQNWRGWAEAIYEMALAVESSAQLTSSAPAAIAASAVVGVSIEAARADHVHAHGAQTNTTLHALATSGLHGFMSSTDKAKLDGMQNAIVFVTVSGTSKTFALSDAYTAQDCQNALATTLTIPTHASVAYETGTVIAILQTGAGQVTIDPSLIVGAGGALRSKGNEYKTSGQYAWIYLTKYSDNVWYMTGDKAA